MTNQAAPAPMQFFPGYHQPSQTKNLERCFVSVHRLMKRVSDFKVNEWIMDSGAFTQIKNHGRFTMSVSKYAQQIARWSSCGTLLAACSQDFMCEDKVLELQTARADADWRDELASECNGHDDPLMMLLTSEYFFDDEDDAAAEERRVTVKDHQRLTLERFVDLQAELDALDCSTYLMPVLQGYEPAEYLEHLADYSAAGLLPFGALVGVGSVCKRNSNAETILEVLTAIKEARPDLQLHGFGLKVTALKDPRVVELLFSSDSMAWSDAARKMKNRHRKAGATEAQVDALPSANCWTTAAAYAQQVQQLIDAAG